MLIEFDATHTFINVVRDNLEFVNVNVVRHKRVETFRQGQRAKSTGLEPISIQNTGGAFTFYFRNHFLCCDSPGAGAATLLILSPGGDATL